MLYRRLLANHSRSLVIARSLAVTKFTATRHVRRYAAAAISSDGIIRSKLSSVEIPTNQSYVEFMLNRCTEHGDAEAIVDDTGKSYTYSNIVDLSKKCGSALVRAGMKKNDVAALFLPNVAEFPVFLFGIQAAGGIVSTVNSRYTSNELAKQLQDCGAKFIITLPSLYKTALEAASHAKIDHVFQSELFLSEIMKDDCLCLPNVHTTENPMEEVICLPYSSGTTGASKGVMQTHYNNIAHTLLLTHKDVMRQNKRDVALAVLPFFHAFGLCFVIGAHFYLGSKLVAMQEFHGEEMLKLIEKHKVTDFPLVPPLVLFLAKHPLVNLYDLSSLESMLSAAAPVGKGLFQEIRKRIPSLKVVREGYGLTEATAGSIANPYDPTKCKDGSVGVVLSNMEAKVTDVKTGETLGPHQEGEVWVRGPTITKGYLNKPEQTAKDFDSEGWLHTGDIGHYDEDEYFYIVDRLKELIKYKGNQVPPAELESVLVSHPHIADAAVIGVPDEAAGELPKAYVVSKAPITTQEIIDFVAEHVAPERKLRGGVEIVDEIPKTASGKILRRVLKEWELLKRKHNQ